MVAPQNNLYTISCNDPKKSDANSSFVSVDDTGYVSLDKRKSHLQETCYTSLDKLTRQPAEKDKSCSSGSKLPQFLCGVLTLVVLILMAGT